jgi:two-component system, response regulator PdtaR
MKAFRVLVVKDDAVIGMLLAEMLEEMDHEICAIAVTEADAVAAIRSRPNLMIVDARSGDGNDVCAVEEILRTRPVRRPFIGGDTLGVQAHSPGAVAIQKPFRESDLARAIQCTLGAAAALLRGQPSVGRSPHQRYLCNAPRQIW